MNVSELQEKLEEIDGEKEVYYMGIGGDWEKVREADVISHDELSVVPYKEEDFVGIK